MASRISQMRNEAQYQQQPPQQQQLNDSIERTRALMQQVKNSPNRDMALAQILQTNPNTAFIANLLQGGAGLEGIAKQIAQNKGYNIKDVINRLIS